MDMSEGRAKTRSRQRMRSTPRVSGSGVKRGTKAKEWGHWELGTSLHRTPASSLSPSQGKRELCSLLGFQACGLSWSVYKNPH